ncbi:hypothetical protein AGOR_G00212020 [Albula goreensis]|uniref:Ig-like domain-containing protein n=1 Tax=Albula goreensis TaxID=1534307 RepID=A0A8T3CPA7_9TELE|nr:hypothetical protein AGOR_G00212020 [Albula goreensis]
MESYKYYRLFVISRCMALFTVVRSQHVSVDPQVTAYLGYDVTLRCQFIQGDPKEVKLFQVQWRKELLETAVVTKSPTEGTYFGETPLKGRVSLISDSMEDASISISNVNETDEGRYTCKYLAFPVGVTDATTTLTVQVKQGRRGLFVILPISTLLIIAAFGFFGLYVFQRRKRRNARNVDPNPGSQDVVYKNTPSSPAVYENLSLAAGRSAPADTEDTYTGLQFKDSATYSTLNGLVK